jgi:hypothetical protein
MVPRDLILRFFEAAIRELDQLLFSSKHDEPLASPNLHDCRRFVLDTQITVLASTVKQFNAHYGTHVTTEEVQQYLATLGLQNSHSIDPTILDAMTQMEDSARSAVCRLALWSETHRQDESSRELQKDGQVDRSKLLQFLALCQAAIQLPQVKAYLAEGTPLFDDLKISEKEEPTAMKLPQARLERIQCLISKALGWDPKFIAKELRSMFFVQDGASNFAQDPEVMTMFQTVMQKMSSAVATASLQASKHQLSDLEDGGVTRVVAVNFSDITPMVAYSRNPFSPYPTAPPKVTMNPHVTEDVQKRQIRIASEATRLQQDLLQELRNMTEEQRIRKLEEARVASENFVATTLSFPPGPERIAYLQSMDPQTSRLLAMHKLWPTIPNA